MIKWRIYYDESRTYDYIDGRPEEAPGHGVIAIVQDDKDLGRTVLNGWDWYYYDGAEWWGADIHGLLDRLCHSLPTFAVKQGRMVATNVWQDTMDRAVADSTFKPKSGIHKKERPFQQVGWS